MRRSFYALVLCSMVFISACMSTIGYYNPDPKIAQGTAAGFSASGPVCIVNDQPSREKHVLDFRKIEVDYHEFTQSLADALGSELEQHGTVLDDHADKQLFLKVTSIQMMNLGAVYRAKIKAVVKTSDGTRKMFLSTRASYASPFNMSSFPTKPLDAAFKDLVAKILTEPRIQEYVKQRN